MQKRLVEEMGFTNLQIISYTTLEFKVLGPVALGIQKTRVILCFT